MTEGTIFKAGKLDRRQFLKTSGGLLLLFSLPAGMGVRSVLADEGTPGALNNFICIGTDGTITIYVGGGEMGQGIYTGLAQGAAEELMVDWESVKVEPLPASLSWLSAGSSGIRRRLQTFRNAGATAREMLIAAAAQTWGVAPGDCIAASGEVTNTISGAVLSYAELASLAATMPVPENPPLVPASEYRVIGQPCPRPDIPSKTNGSAKYGIDAVLPGMVFAAIKHCPVMGGTLNFIKEYNPPAGVLAVVPLDNAVAVVATNTWLAMEEAKEVDISWNMPPGYERLDSAVFEAQAQQLMGRGAAYIAEKDGDPEAGFAGASQVLDLSYSVPYLAHCCMEVLNCTVRLTETTCEVWAPTQAPSSVLNTAAAVTGLPKSAITVYPLFMGGGLGRKFEQDYVDQAIRVAQAVGQPVKLTWSREQDMANDQFRPMALCRIRAGVDAAGNIVAWSNRHVSSSISAQRGRALRSTGDGNATEGATHLPYDFGSRLVEYVVHPSPIPVGYWRSVGYAINAFAVESALDEIALATNTDPLLLRQQLLTSSTDPLAARSLAVLNAAASLGDWGTPPPAGRERGIALAIAFNTIVAEVAEVSAPAPGSLRVHKVACAVDCGTAVNPNQVEAQMEGGIFHGLSAALWGEVKWNAGRASAKNFNNYRVLVMSEAPEISVEIVNSGESMTGCGEPGVPPIAPAVANAYARLTGLRMRALPFFPGATMND